ncbi:unnamed protein product [Rhizoctonia solani]|uniref:F-box domain-containing protein n=1 Tax=Rhizoctonia solani TaxID=456999 RepID=A0A8H2XMN1_9AGAM|nr:unnamed protein product [Rhizoctonia solani]
MDVHPFTVIEGLESAGNKLRVALDEYFSACSGADGLLPDALRDLPRGYLHDIDTEITHFPSYEPKLRQAEATVRRIRNRLPQVTPISLLPPEILVHIFHLVANPCDIRVIDAEDSGSDTSTSSNTSEDWNADAGGDLERRRHRTLQLDNFPTHLDSLTHVCSYWRRVAINSPSLWTHVDFIPHKSLHRELLARAETHIARAGQLPIELHVMDSNPLAYSAATLRRFLSSIRHRVRSLNVAVTHNWRQFHGAVLNELFLNHASKPTALTKLTTSFPMADDETDEFVDWFDDTNDGFGHLTVLHLHGLFPLWRSVAYHNLVDLRLSSPSDERWARISELALQAILEASPGLRVLHFALQITDRQRDDKSIIPVHLNHLEVLSISTYRGREEILLRPGHVLRLIAPGSKPLRLSICHSLEEDDLNGPGFSYSELVKFFRRSNIAKFCTKYAYPQLDRLLCHASNLEDLALDSCMFGWQGTKSLHRSSPATSRLNSLILHNCSPSLDQLEVLLEQHPAKQVFLCRCHWGDIEDPFLVQSPFERVLELFGRYPDTKLITQPSNPTVSWDLVD